jgi:peptidoglycan/LPS O-acetylase OafA/YrhL
VWILLHNSAREGDPDILAAWMVLSGSTAVSAFFCLSGFIMVYNYGSHAFDSRTCYLSFLGKRYARLMPLYWLSQLLAVGAVVQTARSEGVNEWSVMHYIATVLGINTWLPWPNIPANGGIRRGTVIFNAALWTIQTEVSSTAA